MSRKKKGLSAPSMIVRTPMPTVDFEAELDRLAALNGVPRSKLDEHIREARAYWFATKKQIAQDHLLLRQLRILLAGEGLAREIAVAPRDENT